MNRLIAIRIHSTRFGTINYTYARQLSTSIKKINVQNRRKPQICNSEKILNINQENTSIKKDNESLDENLVCNNPNCERDVYRTREICKTVTHGIWASAFVMFIIFTNILN